MGTTDRWAIEPFWHPGKCYGVLLRIQRRLYIIGALQRGIFWRFNAKTYQPQWFYWESIFALKTQIKKIEFMAKVGMRDENMPVFFRRNRIRGSIHFSRTGVMSMLIWSMDSEYVNEKGKQNPKDFAPMENDLLGTVESRKEWY